MVTILFTDVTGFTTLGEQLDPESLHQVIGRWFEGADRVIERHGGAVEKHMGDAVMAVFGVPQAHEDDALRAARAALEMREALAALNRELRRRWDVELGVRTGINTGEVVVGDDPSGELSVLGDAVNVAQRLEAAAEPGAVLVGEQTARLIGDAATLDRVDALDLKGKAAPVAAWRLSAVASERARTPAEARSPFVGREAELALLRQAFDGVAADATPKLVTVLGTAGIGKSRLARALIDEIGDQATVVIGRCLSYGETITYWPLTEIARQLAAPADEATLAALVREDKTAEEADLIASRIARATGLSPGSVPIEEAQWAARNLLEAIAHRGPLVVVFEDIHWAAPTLLDLISDLARSASAAPLLVLCLARPELLDERPQWPGPGGTGAAEVRLEPLSTGEAAELLERLGPGAELTTDRQAQLLAAAEGNPFYLQQMIAMQAESEQVPAEVPPTIRAVLTARIDRLSVDEREVIEAASIEGRTFHRGAIEHLVADGRRASLDLSLSTLVDRELVRPARADLPDEQAFRFDHILIRNAAYGLIPKWRRADLHEGYARWLERRSGGGLPEQGEIAGYHLEQAFHYRVEVEPAAKHEHLALATGAGAYLGEAGRGALAGEDLPAAIGLLERAIALLPADEAERGVLVAELGVALTEAGQLAEAEALLEGSIEQAAARGDSSAQAHAAAVRLYSRLMVDTGSRTREEIRSRFDWLLATFEGDRDDLGLDRLWRLRGLVLWTEARSADADVAWQRAVEHARRAGDDPGRADALTWLASSAFYGPVFVDAGIARCQAIGAQLSPQSRAQAIVLDTLAGLRAMRGEFAAARGLLAESNSILDQLGRSIYTAVSHPESFVLIASGDLAGAETLLRAGYERLAEMGEKALLASTATILAGVVRIQGRVDEAWELTETARHAAADDDLSPQITWRTERARLLARQGAGAEAKQLSAEAVALAERTDWLSERADALVAQADVLEAAGEASSAGSALRQAISLYERKGNKVGVQRAGARLARQVPA